MFRDILEDLKLEMGEGQNDGCAPDHKDGGPDSNPPEEKTAPG